MKQEIFSEITLWKKKRKKKMRLSFFLIVGLACATVPAAAQNFKPSFARCPEDSSKILLKCAQLGTAETCNDDTQCSWCDRRVSTPIVPGSTCTDADGSCTCAPPESTPTPTPTPSGAITGFCTPATAALPESCAIDYSLVNGTSACYEIDYGTGGCPVTSGAAQVAVSGLMATALALAILF